MTIKRYLKLLGVVIILSAVGVSPFLPSVSNVSVSPSASIAKNSSTTLIGCAKFTAHGSTDPCNIVYVHVYVFFNSSSNGLIYLSEQQISSAGPCTPWELAGGLGTSAQYPTWTVMSSLLDPSYSPNAPSSSNPTSSWCWNPYGFWKDSPDNPVSCGTSGTVSVTTGLTVGLSAGSSSATMQVSGSLSASYAVTCSFSEPKFCLEPIRQSSSNNSWYFSDNQGFHGTNPYSATVYEGSVIHAVVNNYNSMWVRDWGHFVAFNSNRPTYDTAYGNAGAIYYIS